MFRWILIRKIKKYLQSQYVEIPPIPSRCREEAFSIENVRENQLPVPDFLKIKDDVEKYIDKSLENAAFAERLNQYMCEKNLTTAVIYRRCLVDRKLISKITTQENYHPSKSTVFALCIGLQLNLQQGEDFLSLAGYSFDRSSKRDLIVKFMLENQIYDLDEINEMLLYFGQQCFE